MCTSGQLLQELYLCKHDFCLSEGTIVHFSMFYFPGTLKHVTVFETVLVMSSVMTMGTNRCRKDSSILPASRFLSDRARHDKDQEKTRLFLCLYFLLVSYKRSGYL